MGLELKEKLQSWKKSQHDKHVAEKSTSLAADLAIPPAVYNWKIYTCAIFASCAAIMCGYDSGFIGGTIVLDSFEDEFGMKLLSKSALLTTKANIISFFHVGAFFGSLFIYPVNFLLGRRLGLMVASVFLLVGSGIQLAAKTSTGLAPLYAGRVILGFGIGGISNVAPMYIAEIAPATIRGRLVGMYEVSWQIGGTVGFFINYGTDQHQSGNLKWIIPIAIQLVPAGLFAIGLFFIAESPRWLFSRGRIEEGYKALAFLRNLPKDHQYLQYEADKFLEEAKQAEAKVGTGLWAPVQLLITNSHLRYRLLLSTSIFILQNTSGINAVNYYSPTLFKAIGVSSTSSSLLSTGIFGVLKGVSSTIWAIYIVDRFGRRKSIFFGCTACSVCLFYIGAYIKVANPESHTSMDSGGKAAMAFFYLWCIFYSFSISGLPWVLSSELYDQTVRATAQTAAATGNWFWAFIFARFTGNMVEKMKAYGVFFFFATGVLLAVFIYYLFYPETANIPVEDVGLLFTPGVPAWKAHEHALKVIRDRELGSATAEEIKEMQANSSFSIDARKQGAEYVEMAGSSSE